MGGIMEKIDKIPNKYKQIPKKIVFKNSIKNKGVRFIYSFTPDCVCRCRREFFKNKK